MNRLEKVPLSPKSTHADPVWRKILRCDRRKKSLLCAELVDFDGMVDARKAENRYILT
jgi:hypothetical protein